MPDDSALAIAAAFEVFGSRFLEFVCATEASRMDERRDGSLLEPHKEQVLGAVASFAATALERSRQQGVPAQLLVDSLGGVTPDGMTVANHLRTLAGGSLPDVSSSDSIAQLLGKLGRGSYPLFLIRRPHEMPGLGPSLTASLFHHPLHKSFVKEVLADSELSRLYPAESDTSGRHGVVIQSTGSARTHQAELLASSLLSDAFVRATLLGDGTPQAFVNEAVTAIHRLRSLLRGEAQNTPVLVGFTNVLLPQGAVVELPWGVLRELTQAQRQQLVLPALEGMLTHTDGETRVTVSYSGDVVLETEMPLRIQVEQEFPEVGGVDLPRDTTDIFEQQLGLVAMSFALAINREPPVLPVSTWRLVFDPFGHGPQLSWSDASRHTAGPPYQLREADAVDVQRWGRKVQDAHASEIDVTVRRLISAIALRRDPADALIDTVICWENLFGSRQGETTLRISAAMAWLLEQDSTARAELQSEIKDIYSVRSDLVHGNPPTRRRDPSRLAAEVRAPAIRLTIQALRRLYKDRPELIGDAARATKLLLNAHSQ